VIKRTAGLSIFILILLFPLHASSEQKELLIGLIPEENIFKQMDRYRPLATYLSEKLGIKVRLTILSKYGDVIDRFASRGMDGAFFEAFTASLAMVKLNLEPIVRPINLDGTSTIKNYIFVRKDSEIRSVKDMKDKIVAFVDRAATGYVFAVAFFKENGIRDIDSYFREYYFTGSHDSAVYAVLDNRADIGSAGSRIYQRIIDKDPVVKDELHIITTSKELPDTTLCVRHDLYPELKLKIKEVLLNMDKDPEGAEVLKKFGALRFIGADKADFRPVFDLAKKAGIDIKRY
jgi:phosphonate transport system substrate-binding protein